MHNILLELKRNELVSQSRSNIRFKKRLKSRIPSNSRTYNRLDMNKLFKEDILEVYVEVIGETDTYEVGISFSGVIGELKREAKKQGKLDLRTVIRAVIRAFSSEDIYTKCSCPDFKYRFAYWSTIDKYILGDPEMRPAEITNPEGNLGSTCKHGLLVLNNQVWVLKVGSVINNYIRYMRLRNRDLYDKIIQPALFDDEQDDIESIIGIEDRQISMDIEEPEAEPEEEDIEEEDIEDDTI